MKKNKNLDLVDFYGFSTSKTALVSSPSGESVLVLYLEKDG